MITRPVLQCLRPRPSCSRSTFAFLSFLSLPFPTRPNFYKLSGVSSADGFDTRGVHPSDPKAKYTVPVIHHLPTHTFLMDSFPIAQFIQSTYPDPPMTLSSEIGDEVEAGIRIATGKAYRNAVMPREIRILRPPAQAYFRRTRELTLGHRLEDLLDSEEEEEEEATWEGVVEGMKELGPLMRRNEADGPFLLGAKPSYTDFFIAGSLECARVVDESVFQRLMRSGEYEAVYKSCLPYMGKRD